MDGNQRWAKQNNKKSIEGYLAGLNNLKTILDYCINQKIKYLTIYALSSENLKRDSIINIYEIIRSNYKNILSDFYKQKVNINLIGEKNNIPRDIINIFKSVNIVNDPSINLNIAFNYGTQFEIKNIITELITNKKKDITVELIRSQMYLGKIPDPEILIRTGGHKRLSNFILLNLSYTELFFVDTMWPDFSIVELSDIIINFNNIKRNYGL